MVHVHHFSFLAMQSLLAFLGCLLSTACCRRVVTGDRPALAAARRAALQEKSTEEDRFSSVDQLRRITSEEAAQSLSIHGARPHRELATLLLAPYSSAFAPKSFAQVHGARFHARCPARADIRAQATEDPRYAPFLAWFEDEGGQLGPVELGKSGVGLGSGVFATRDIEEGEELFSVPDDACLSVFTAIADPDMGDTLAQICVRESDNNDREGGESVALAGFLAKEWLKSGEKGAFGPYLAMLPFSDANENDKETSRYPSHVVWWSDKQLEDLQFERDLYFEADGTKDSVILAYKALNTVIAKPVKEARNDLLWSFFGATEDIKKAVQGAFAAILSRSFIFDTQDDKTARLVPMFDMLQHTDITNVNVDAQWAVDAEGNQGCVVYAQRPIAKGEELVRNYGCPREPWRFLTYYGFIDKVSPTATVGAWPTVDEYIDSRKPKLFGLR